MAKDIYHCKECGSSLIGSWPYAVKAGKCNNCQAAWYRSCGGVACPRCGQRFSPNDYSISKHGMCEGCYSENRPVKSVNSKSDIELWRGLEVGKSGGGSSGTGCMVILPLIAAAMTAMLLLLVFIH